MEQFAERVDGEAKLVYARKGGTQIASGPITQQTGAGVTLHCAGISPDENATRQLSDPGTPLGHAYARAFAESAAAHVAGTAEA